MTHIRSRKHVVAALAPLGAASLMALAAAPAFAADAVAADDQAGNLVTSVDVTAKAHYKTETVNAKATTSLLDTPQTRQIIGAELMQERGATTLTEALQNSPGVGTFFLGENGNTNTGDAIYMRGSDISGSIMIDGVRNVGSIFRDVFNIDQVEVLKGGAGAEIGRGAATGAINMYTKHASLNDFKAGSVSFGSGADVNMQISGSAAARLNLVVQDAGVAGRDHIANDRWGIAPTVGFGLDSSTRVFLDYMYIKQDNVPDGGVLTIGLPGYSSPDPTGRPYLTTAPRVNSKNFYGTTDDHDDVTVNTAAVVLEHDFSDDITIRNLTRWSATDQDYQLTAFLAGNTQLTTPSATDLSTWTIPRTVTNKSVVNDAIYNGTILRAKVSTGPFKHTIAAGLELIRERQKNRTYVGTGAYARVSVYNPSHEAGGYTRAFSGAYTQGITETKALYFNDNIELTEKLFLNGGGRLDSYRTSYDSVTAANVKTSFSAEDDLFSGNVGLVFKPVKEGSIYLSYANTKQPPGGANFSLAAGNSANANNPNVEPQTAENTELGVKWNIFHDRLMLSGALYKTEYSDQIIQDTDGTFYRAGAKQVSGVELSAVGQITPRWSVNAGFATQDTEVSSPTGSFGTADGSAVLTYSPDKSFSLWTTYRFPVGLTIGGGARYSGDMKRGSDGAVGTPQFVEGYWVWDAMAAYRLRPNVELQFNVYNLADEDYVPTINKSGYRYTPAIPRSARLALNVSF